MLGAIYIGLSGMDADTNALQIISNNVANLNTDGFKAATVSFADLFSNGGNGSTFIGSNTAQGDGVRIGNSLIEFSQGTLRQSTNDLDLAIQGGGFLVLLNADGTTSYTRTGQFAVDKDGFISEQGTSSHLAVLDSSNHPVAVNVNSKQTSPPAATTKIVFENNLSSSGLTASVPTIPVFDSRGNQQSWTVNFTKSQTIQDDWDVTVTDANGATVATTALKFNGSVIDPTTSTLAISQTPSGADPLNVTLDFSAVSSFSGGTSSTIGTSSVDGNATGTLSTVTADSNGEIVLTYSNQKTENLGAVAIADFRDPEQLKQASNGLFSNPHDAQVRFLASGAGGIGTLVSKQLEASNVNLTQEFGDLILVQRGFQACSEVLSVSNDMIQQLFGIRGQG